jgi:hypothetical protein
MSLVTDSGSGKRKLTDMITMTPVSKPLNLHQPGTKKCRTGWDDGGDQSVNVKFVVVNEDDLEIIASDLGKCCNSL